MIKNRIVRTLEELIYIPLCTLDHFNIRSWNHSHLPIRELHFKHPHFTLGRDLLQIRGKSGDLPDLAEQRVTNNSDRITDPYAFALGRRCPYPRDSPGLLGNNNLRPDHTSSDLRCPRDRRLLPCMSRQQLKGLPCHRDRAESFRQNQSESHLLR